VKSSELRDSDRERNGKSTIGLTGSHASGRGPGSVGNSSPFQVSLRVFGFVVLLKIRFEFDLSQTAAVGRVPDTIYNVEPRLKLFDMI
jgi:hypothetical protein